MKGVFSMLIELIMQLVLYCCLSLPFYHIEPPDSASSSISKWISKSSESAAI